MIRAWLTRQANGEFLLSALRPIISQVGKTGRNDVYVRPGDPVGYRHMCPTSVALIWGEWTETISELESVRVTAGGELLSEIQHKQGQ